MNVRNNRKIRQNSTCMTQQENEKYEIKNLALGLDLVSENDSSYG